MKGSEFIKLNLKFEILNVGTNVNVKITNLRTAVRQLANTLTVRKFSKWIVIKWKISMASHYPKTTGMYFIFKFYP
jgi:hypothetical protein